MPTPEVASRKIASFIEQRADDYLRNIVYYDEEEYELLYVRDDVLSQYSADEIQAVIDDLRWQSFEKSHQEGLYVHGDLRCTVRCFDNAVEMHFPHDTRTGTAIAFDPEAAEEIYSFIGDCLTRLQQI